MNWWQRLRIRLTGQTRQLRLHVGKADDLPVMAGRVSDLLGKMDPILYLTGLRMDQLPEGCRVLLAGGSWADRRNLKRLIATSWAMRNVSTGMLLPRQSSNARNIEILDIQEWWFELVHSLPMDDWQTEVSSRYPGPFILIIQDPERGLVHLMASAELHAPIRPYLARITANRDGVPLPPLRDWWN